MTRLEVRPYTCGMHRSFDLLSVRDDAELRDPRRVARLFRRYHLGNLVVFYVIGALGLPLLGATLWLAFHGAQRQGVVIGLCLAVMMPAFAAAFGQEAFGSPLRGYAREPHAYDFAPAQLVEAYYLSDGDRRGAKMRVRGRFGSGGLFFADFNPRLWSSCVAEEGEEEGLKPGDDRYDQKGKRARLPLDAWVLFRRDRPTRAELVGLPAAVVDRLKRKR